MPPERYRDARDNTAQHSSSSSSSTIVVVVVVVVRGISDA